MSDRSVTDLRLAPGLRVEWRSGSSDDCERGTLVRSDDDMFGPSWLVQPDDSDGPTLVKTYALYPEGGIRRERVADAIHSVMRQRAHSTQSEFPPYSHAVACADAVLALDGGAR